MWIHISYGDIVHPGLIYLNQRKYSFHIKLPWDEVCIIEIGVTVALLSSKSRVCAVPGPGQLSNAPRLGFGACGTLGERPEPEDFWQKRYGWQSVGGTDKPGEEAHNESIRLWMRWVVLVVWEARYNNRGRDSRRGAAARKRRVARFALAAHWLERQAELEEGSDVDM